jgi:chemotaxis response regulator CheB
MLNSKDTGLVDDSELIRALLRALFRETSRFEIIGEASDDSEAIRITRELLSDVIIMDAE